MVAKKQLTYSGSGVNIEEADRFVDLIKPFVRSTQGDEVLSSYGGFAGVYVLPDGKTYLVGSTDGVGTKLKIALAASRLNTVGIDLVAMCVNDMLTCGARPLFFLDYIATAQLDAEQMSGVVKGIADGCTDAGCTLLGGETAEMPGFYTPGEFDLAGFAVGMVEKDRHINGEKVAAGDEIVGIPSNGVHSNGYSLIRKALLEKRGLSLQDTPEGLSRPLGDELLEPTKIYARGLGKLFEQFEIHSAAHITGGGLTGNIPRSLPDGCAAFIETSSWRPQPIFDLIKECTGLEDADMFSTFNCGMGMTLTVDSKDSSAVITSLESEGCKGARVIGKVGKADDGKPPGVVFT